MSQLKRAVFATTRGCLANITKLESKITGRNYELTLTKADGHTFRVAWTTDWNDRVYTTPLNGAATPVIKDIAGNVITGTVANGKVTLTFSQATGPILIPLD